jgi:hypothetical protein
MSEASKQEIVILGALPQGLTDALKQRYIVHPSMPRPIRSLNSRRSAPIAGPPWGMEWRA